MATKHTPGFTKNMVRRSLRVIIDPEPSATDIRRLREYFQDQCAYCGVVLAKGFGDIDHLVSAAQGGSNGLSNRVLSCGNCNAREKRDRPWLEFLREKSTDAPTYAARETRILNWLSINGGEISIEPELMEILNQEYEQVSARYDIAVQRLRDHRMLRKSKSQCAKNRD